jgi:hypothetical protein
VFVVRGMALALVAAALTDLDARLEDCIGNARLVARLPREDARGHLADIGAILARANALAELIEHLLAEIRVGAAVTRLRTCDAFLDPLDEEPLVDADLTGKGSEDFGSKRNHLVTS